MLTTQRPEPSVDEMVNDPIVRALMASTVLTLTICSDCCDPSR